MKKKLIAILLVVVSILCAFSLSGCNFSPSAPTEQTVSKRVKSRWNIDLPQNLTLTNYFLDVGPRGDGLRFYELNYNGNDLHFNELLNTGKNIEFENRVFEFNKFFDDRDCAGIIHSPEFEKPSFDENYLWLKRQNRPVDKEDPNTSYFEELFIAYFNESNKLIILDNKI